MNKKGVESEKEGKKNLKSEKKIVYYKAARNVKKLEKNLFSSHLRKMGFGGGGETGENFTKIGRYMQIFFLKFMHKKRMNFASRNREHVIRISN